MAKVAILTDIHGNLPAFEAVLKEVDKESVDLIIFGGDIIGYGASPAECVKYVRSLGGHCVFGNHESYLKAVSDNGMDSLAKDWRENAVDAGVVHAFKTVAEEDQQWIFKLPWFMPIDDTTIIAHAGLNNPNDWPYIESEESARPTLEIMKKRTLSLGFFGHIHRFAVYPETQPTIGNEKYHFKNEDIVAVTAGSVGQPRELNDKRASWVLFDSEDRMIECRRTKYDQKKAAKQIIDAGLPERSALRLLS